MFIIFVVILCDFLSVYGILYIINKRKRSVGMKKIGDFETNLESIDEIIEKLESGELSLENSIKEYEKAMKLIKSSSEILNRAEGKIIKVSDNNGEITFEEGDV